jgi:O-antigen/teichoic acid export membrane protein
VKPESVIAILASLVRDSGSYLVGTAVVGLGNFVLVPLYTRTLNPAEFGVYSLVEIAVLLLVGVSPLKLDISYLKWFADLGAKRSRRLLGSVLAACGLTAAVGGIVLALVVISPIGKSWLQTDQRGFAWLLCPVVFLESLQALLLTDLRAKRRPISYSTAVSIRLVVIVLASLYLLVVRHQGITGVFLGRLVGDCAGVLFVLVSVGRLELTVDTDLLRPMISFGAPLILSMFAVMMQDFAGRYFLSRYSSLAEVGLFGAAIKLAAVFQLLITQPFGAAWGGVMFQINRGPNAKIVYSKIFAYTLLVSITLVVVLTIFSRALFAVFTSPAYYGAAVVFPLILLTRAAVLMEYPASIGIFLAGRTKIFLGIYLAGLLVDIALLALLIPRLGMLGAAWAWLAASLLVTALMATVSQRFFRLTFTRKLLLLPIVLSAVLLLARRSVLEVLGVLHWPAQTALALLALLGAGALLVYDLRSTRRVLHVPEMSFVEDQRHV